MYATQNETLTYEQLACALASVAVDFAQPIVDVVERFLAAAAQTTKNRNEK